MLWIVGIGASAGGLDACRTLLSHLPNTGHLACVIANHQALDGHTEILVRQLGLVAHGWEVTIARNGDAISAGKVYVIAAGNDAKVKAGRLILTPPHVGNLSSPSVDMLLASIAQEYGSRGVGVILSGTGSDGVAGCRALRGLAASTFVQSDARFTGMPEAARAASVAEHSLPAPVIAAHLARLGQPAQPACEVRLEDLVELVHRHTGHDFSGYKPETLNRRAQARMTKLGIASLAEYLDYARQHEAEVTALQEHFLVSLSSFYRDPECFESLRGYLEAALSKASAFTIWTPGCASGEESYSLAMLAKEIVGARQVDIKVFATDLNPDAVALAEQGSYSEISLEKLDPALVTRYFERTGRQYRVRESLRTICTFRCQNAFRAEAPTELDLISCRNLLIYLRMDWQVQLIRKFHRALSPEGLLFIGPSETLGPLGNSVFQSLNAQHRVYRRRPGQG